MKPNSEIETVKHKDINGKEQLYLRITGTGGTTVINIGQKTFTRVQEILKIIKIQPIEK